MPDVEATRMIFEERDGEKVHTVEYLVSTERVLVRSALGADVALYDRRSDSLWMLGAPESASNPINRAAAKALAGWMQENREAFVAQLEEKSPAAGQRARSDLARLIGARASVRSVDTAVETGDHACVARYSCELYRLEASGKALGHACITDAAEVRFGTTLLDMLRLVAGVYTLLGDAGGGALKGSALGSPLLPEQLLTGLPLALELRDDEGRTARGLALLSVEAVQVPGERFVLPEAARG
jgi:hypothetical protein